MVADIMECHIRPLAAIIDLFMFLQCVWGTPPGEKAVDFCSSGDKR
jgi:hypothetical protein